MASSFQQLCWRHGTCSLRKESDGKVLQYHCFFSFGFLITFPSKIQSPAAFLSFFFTTHFSFWYFATQATNPSKQSMNFKYHIVDICSKILQDSLLQKDKVICEVLVAAAILDAIFQPRFKIREETCTSLRNKNSMEENVCPSSTY